MSFRKDNQENDYSNENDQTRKTDIHKKEQEIIKTTRTKEQSK